MSLFAPLKRRLSRASFVDVLPISAFLLGGFLASIFTIFYQVQWAGEYHRTVESHASKVVQLTKRGLLEDNISQISTDMELVAPAGVVLTTQDGDILTLVDGPRLLNEGRKYRIEHEGTFLGEIIVVPTLRFKPPMPYPVMFALILFCALVAAWMIRILTKIAARHLHMVRTYVDNYDIETLDITDVPNISFKEFRGLNAVALMTTRRLNREIRRFRNLARRDERTGFPNRYDFEQHLEVALQQATLENPQAVVMVRIQNWPSQRNRFNHGDAEIALRLFAERLQSLIRRDDVTEHGLQLDAIARTGEQTFSVLISGLSHRDDLSGLVRACQRELGLPIEIGRVSIKPDIGAAIAMIPRDGDTVQRVFHALQITLQNLTEDEQVGFKFYSPKLDRQNEARRKLERELREAIANEAFVPVYQPKIDLKTGQMCGVEALARWKLDNGRLVSPYAFITLAEDLGIINKIGEQIMRKSAKDAAVWVKAGHDLNLAVNVSPIQFNDPHLSQMILKAIADSGLPPRYLELEITESVAVQKPEQVRAILAPLRKLGVRLAVDDFGTGHSNLAILTQFSFDTFKIDRQFIDGTPHDLQATAIVDMMLGMAKSLGMEIVGEGVETMQQAQYLSRQGCHIGQGYFFSKPIEAQDITNILARQSTRKAS